MTPAQLEVLKRADTDESTSAGALADRVGVGRATMTRLLDRLEARDMLARERDPADKRRVLVELTDEGRRIAREVEQPLRTKLAAVLDSLPARDRERLADNAHELVQLLGAEDEYTAPLDAAARRST